MTNQSELTAAAERLLDLCRRAKLMVATAESCTGGLVAGYLTEIAGSSDVVERGFVTYSNAAKSELLGVPGDILEAHGAVSAPVARAMAEGALRASRADIAVSITGVAGPGGGSPAKPVGLVHFGCARRDVPTLHRERHYGDPGRHAIRLAAVAEAFDLIAEMVSQRPSV